MPTVARNVLSAIPEMISRLAGASRIIPLQVLSIAVVVCGFLAPTSGKERYAPYAQHVQSMNEIVMMGESVPAGRHRLEIKGVVYEVIREEVWEGLPVTFLRKKQALMF